MNTMIEVLGWNVGVGVWSLQTLVLWSVLFGFASTLVGTVQTSYHWLWTAAAALVGGWLGSEWLSGANPLDPMIDGLALLQALIGAVVLAAVVDLMVRTATGGSYTRRRRVIGGRLRRRGAP